MNKDLNMPFEMVYKETDKYIEAENHFHNAYEMIFIIEGKVKFSISDKVYEAGKNDIFFISNHEQHDYKVVEFPYKRFFLLVDPEYFISIMNDPVLASIFKSRPGHFSHCVHLPHEHAGAVDELVRRIYEESCCKNDYWQAASAANLQLLMVALYRSCREAFPLTAPTKAVSTVFEIQKYIDKHCTEEISLQETAKLFFTDMYHISHLFRKVTGYSFREYLILQRISKAKDLLFYTSEDITNVSMLAGFNNVNNFIRTFKKFTGVTPYRYRMRYR